MVLMAFLAFQMKVGYVSILPFSSCAHIRDDSETIYNEVNRLIKEINYDWMLLVPAQEKKRERQFQCETQK